MTKDEHELEELWDYLCANLGILDDLEKQDIVRHYGDERVRMALSKLIEAMEKEKYISKSNNPLKYGFNAGISKCQELVKKTELNCQFNRTLKHPPIPDEPKHEWKTLSRWQKCSVCGFLNEIREEVKVEPKKIEMPGIGKVNDGWVFGQEFYDWMQQVTDAINSLEKKGE